MGAQIIGGILQLPGYLSLPQARALIASMKVFGEALRGRECNTFLSSCAKAKPVFEAKVFPTLQEAHFDVNACERRRSVTVCATL
jgi:hypothetical protein